MPGLLFLSQVVIDSWAERGDVEYQDGAMFLVPGKGPRRYAIDPAVRFVKTVGAVADRHALVGKVKTNAQLRLLGAECLGDSVLMGEVAYEVQSGYLASEAPGEAAGSAQAPGDSQERDGAEALARFLIEKLS
ncbi:MAG TPA: hypothetical protein VLV17_00495 [Anaeromyxobacteraceae bacterium]|nr:hypothetical protein [Anaeromyxobacteraceae bacterium]